MFPYTPQQYNPYGPNFQQMQMPQQMPPQQMGPRQEIARVNGENGAQTFPLAPSSSVLLLDEHKPIVYLKTTDAGGYPTITAYAIAPVQPEQPAGLTALEARIKRLEDLYNEQPNTASTERSKEPEQRRRDVSKP